MALPWEENYQTEATPAPKPRPVQPVVMSPPAAAVAPDPLVAAMQTRNATAATAPAVAPAAAAMPALPPPPKQEVNEAPVNYKRRLSEYYQRIDQMKIDAVKEAEKTAREAAAPAKKRDLTSGEVEKITGLDNSLGTQMRLMETFKPEYAGYGIKFAGDIANTIGSTFGGDKQSQAEWWAAHEANDNVARNALFGASLTAGEKAAWDKTSISPGMNPSMVENRMRERAALIDAKRKTSIENLGKANYNVENFQTAPNNFAPAAVAAPPVSMLKEGHITTFANGQQWSMRNGKAERVK
jgi:hypothetical protein